MARVWDHPTALPPDQLVPVAQPGGVEVQQLISIQAAGKR